MISTKLCRWRQILSTSFIILTLAFTVWAQGDPNPDSPTPILMSGTDSARALAVPADKFSDRSFFKKQSKTFSPNQKIILFATNLELMEGEGATAFRIAVEDAKGRKYRFPVLDIQSLKGQEWIYALTVELRDVLGFREQPRPNGDVLINLTWRGLSSNRLRLGLGKTGGKIKDDVEAINLKPRLVSTIKNSDEIFEPESVGYIHSGDRTRFMEQATFGPTAALDMRLRRIGLQTWLAEQFDAPYPTYSFPDIPLMPTNPTSNCNGTENPNSVPPDLTDIYPQCRRDRYTLFPVQNWFFKEAFYGDAQLHHRVAWALSQIWVVSGVDTQQSSHFINYYKVLSNNAFGNYRTLMQEMTLNPGMGNYLDMSRSTKDNPNENFAREVLQLFSIGVFMLNQDGTLQRDADNNPIPTYDQTTVNNFTKVFTGWSFCETTGASCPNRSLGAPNYKDPMLLYQDNHDVTAKTLLDYSNAVNKDIEENLNGDTELNLALDNIYNHPNVAPFVSRFLIQHLVTSDPTAAYVGRTAAVFNQNRNNPAQLKEVVRAILLDPEARGNVKTDPNYGKLREPVQLATNVLRQFKVQSADGAARSDGYIAFQIAPIGQNIFYSPTVFNYYPPDYIVPGPGLNGPEFAIMTTGTAIARVNFINSIIFNRVNVGDNTLTGTSINLSDMQSLATNDITCNQLLDALNTKMMHGTMTTQNKATMLAAVLTVPKTNPLLRAQMAIYLIATSSQYQVQR